MNVPLTAASGNDTVPDACVVPLFVNVVLIARLSASRVDVLPTVRLDAVSVPDDVALPPVVDI